LEVLQVYQVSSFSTLVTEPQTVFISGYGHIEVVPGALGYGTVLNGDLAVVSTLPVPSLGSHIL
jgi:hypothetical protein